MTTNWAWTACLQRSEPSKLMSKRRNRASKRAPAKVRGDGQCIPAKDPRRGSRFKGGIPYVLRCSQRRRSTDPGQSRVGCQARQHSRQSAWREGLYSGRRQGRGHGGRVNPTDAQRRLGADLGLYSITPNNHLEFDYPTVEAYKQFRIEAEQKGLRHFLEVFDPNACGDKCPADLGRFINDLIVRTLAGVPGSGRPVFLKIAYHGPRAMEELVSYDPTLIPGILGGSSGTTHDAFKLLEEAKRHGARAALFGRKINNSEHQLTFVRYLHLLANGQIAAAEAVKAYHGELEKLKIKPYRAMKDDLELTTNVSSYAGTSGAVSLSKPSLPKAAPSSRAGQQTTGKYKITESMISGSSGPKPSAPTSRPAPMNAKPARAAAKPATNEGGGKVLATAVLPAPSSNGWPRLPSGAPDFKNMSGVQKVAYSRRRIQSDLSRAKEDA